MVSSREEHSPCRRPPSIHRAPALSPLADAARMRLDVVRHSRATTAGSIAWRVGCESMRCLGDGGDDGGEHEHDGRHDAPHAQCGVGAIAASRRRIGAVLGQLFGRRVSWCEPRNVSHAAACRAVPGRRRHAGCVQRAGQYSGIAARNRTRVSSSPAIALSAAAQRSSSATSSPCRSSRAMRSRGTAVGSVSSAAASSSS